MRFLTLSVLASFLISSQAQALSPEAWRPREQGISPTVFTMQAMSQPAVGARDYAPLPRFRLRNADVLRRIAQLKSKLSGWSENHIRLWLDEEEMIRPEQAARVREEFRSMNPATSRLLSMFKMQMAIVEFPGLAFTLIQTYLTLTGHHHALGWGALAGSSQRVAIGLIYAFLSPSRSVLAATGLSIIPWVGILGVPAVLVSSSPAISRFLSRKILAGIRKTAKKLSPGIPVLMAGIMAGHPVLGFFVGVLFVFTLRLYANGRLSARRTMMSLIGITAAAFAFHFRAEIGHSLGSLFISARTFRFSLLAPFIPFIAAAYASRDLSSAELAQRNELIEAHLPLVKDLVKRFIRRNPRAARFKDDLQQIAVVGVSAEGRGGLIGAATKNDPSLETFPGYAATYIRYALRDGYAFLSGKYDAISLSAIDPNHKTLPALQPRAPIDYQKLWDFMIHNGTHPRHAQLLKELMQSGATMTEIAKRYGYVLSFVAALKNRLMKNLRWVAMYGFVDHPLIQVKPRRRVSNRRIAGAA